MHPDEETKTPNDSAPQVSVAEDRTAGVVASTTCVKPKTSAPLAVAAAIFAVGWAIVFRVVGPFIGFDFYVGNRESNVL